MTAPKDLRPCGPRHHSVRETVCSSRNRSTEIPYLLLDASPCRNLDSHPAPPDRCSLPHYEQSPAARVREILAPVTHCYTRGSCFINWKSGFRKPFNNTSRRGMGS